MMRPEDGVEVGIIGVKEVRNWSHQGGNKESTGGPSLP